MSRNHHPRPARRGFFPPIPNVVASPSPALALFNGKLYLAYQGYDSHSTELWYTTYDTMKRPYTWSTTPVHIPDIAMSESPSLAVFDGKLYLAYQGCGTHSSELWYTTTSDGVHWTTATHIPNIGMSGSPSLAAFDGKLYLAHHGGGSNSELWYTTTSDGVSWPRDIHIPNIGMSASPSLAVFNGKLYCAHRAGDNSGLWYTSTSDGVNWPSDVHIPDIAMSGSPALAVCNGSLYAMHQGGGNNGELWYTTTPDGVNWKADWWQGDTDEFGEKHNYLTVSGSPAVATVVNSPNEIYPTVFIVATAPDHTINYMSESWV
jgi:hypothetical protein